MKMLMTLQVTGTLRIASLNSKNKQQKKMPSKPRFQRAVKILKERRNKRVLQFLVLFVDQTSDWTSNVSPGLLNEYENDKG